RFVRRFGIFERAAKHGDGCGREFERGVAFGVDRRGAGGPIGFGGERGWVALGFGFGGGFCGQGGRGGGRGGLSWVIEGNLDGVRIVLVLVDDDERPLSVGTTRGIGGNKIVSGAVANVAFGGEQLVFTAAGLHPFESDELACEKLRERLFDFQ